MALLDWIAHGGLTVEDIPVSSYLDIATYIQKYADQDIDFADAALVWLANQTGEKQILTVDEGDFRIYRLKNGQVFELVPWYSKES